MKSDTRSGRPAATIIQLLAALGALLGACGEVPPQPLEAVDGEAISDAAATPGTITPINAVTTSGAGVDTRGTGTRAPVVDRCDAIPELSAPRNANADASVFELAGLMTERTARRGGCLHGDWQADGDATVRFTSPVAARWRLSVLGPPSFTNYLTVSVHDGCAAGAPGALLRCPRPTAAPAIALDAGQSITVVVDPDGWSAPNSFGLRMERIAMSPAAPELSDVRVSRTARRGALVVGRALDADGDLSLVGVELLDAAGAGIPQPDGLTRYEVAWVSVSSGADLRYTTFQALDRAVRARVWVEDASGRVSAVREVSIDPLPVLANGARCDPEGTTSACDASARCVYSRSLGYTCVPRLDAHYDVAAGSLRVDFDGDELETDSAQVMFLDATGAELMHTERFPWSRRYSGLPRDVLVAYDGWRAPDGLARVRAFVFDRTWRRIATFETEVKPPTIARSWAQCDGTTTARIRCEGPVVCAQINSSYSSFQCLPRDPVCPAAWGARRWAPSADVSAAVTEGRAAAWHDSSPTCLRPAASSSTQDDVIDFVAPVAGAYRFALSAPSTPARYDFALSARRYCGLAGPAAELACVAASAGASAPVLWVTATAGEHIPLLVSSNEPSLSYRLEVAVPQSARGDGG